MARAWRMTRLKTARQALRTSLLKAWLLALLLARRLLPPSGLGPPSAKWRAPNCACAHMHPHLSAPACAAGSGPS